MMKAIRNLLNDERGQGMTEYALIIGVVAVLLIAVLVTFRGQIAALFASIRDKLSSDAGVTVPPTP